MAARKNKSEAWKHFTKLSDRSVKCNLCEKELPTLGGNTSGMHSHLRTTHPDASGMCSSTQPKLQSFGIGPQRPCSEQRQDTITDLLADFMAENLLSMLIVESKSLRRLLEFLEPNFKPPCRQTMTARVTSGTHWTTSKRSCDGLPNSGTSAKKS